ncbi:MAG: bifunctional endoribonuclease/protein kinase ire1 [Alectoria fallacina]|uniref:non-specific serine/threonine protein kinase n=1 Tax=Alectoria fallacina TaxID=1903189 RepID=A0A8H3J8X4_9LECA|nr:MAG: bifunctional endoribonuclease/protein kinase ire1 [Alectoria fallacina]
MRRLLDAARTVVSALTLSLLIMPLLASSQQLPQQQNRKSPHEHPAIDHHTRAASSGAQDESTFETTSYKHRKDTTLNQRKASAVATNPLALAGEDRAVRAVQPARGSGKSAGLTTPLNARSLQDWEVEDFVLLATVDGSIHARDRKTGSPKWKLEVDRPMVETTYHVPKNSLLDGSKPEYDFLWIVEPSRDGDIYIYNQGGLGGLQQLHLTVKQLVADMSPYESVDPAVVYNGEKKTKLYTVDATAGTISKVFGAGGPLSKEPRCPKPGGLDVLDDEECATRGSFVLGRTEYTITIQNRDTTEPICTLKYSEWGPNTRDEDLHSQYSSTMDNKYIYPLHDGSIFGWDYGQMMDRQKSYTQKLSSPVVRVFDVARPLHVDDQDPQLIVLPQPVGPIDNEIYDTFSAKNRIFVNHTEAGGWFAMSESTYPLVTGKAKAAQCYDRDWLEMTTSTQSLTLAQRQEGFVGVHALSALKTRQGSGLTISGPETPAANDSPVEVYQEASLSTSLPIIGTSRIIGTAVDNFSDIFVLCFILAVGTFLYINWRPIFRHIRKRLELEQTIPSVQQQFASVPSSPITATPYAPENFSTTEMDKVKEIAIKPEGEITAVSSMLLEPPPALSRSRSNSLQDHGRKETENAARIQDHSPGPDELEQMESPQLGKKKNHRGQRGGVKRSKKNRGDSKHESKDEAEERIKEVTQLPPVLTSQPEAIKPSPPVATDMTEVAGPIINIGHLSVNLDTILGHGGHGTMVFKGSFGGRDVAVKRMLKEFYEVASHEVSLLQQHDDHPNVIRYFDKETAGSFLYIALELCPASLLDVIERPREFPALVPAGGLNMPNILKQITSGIHYLHTLKIVHRDIKPHNILVSAPKLTIANPSTTQPPRLLISDFGLCKKLEGDQNSFRATTAFAAGTSGWRAPELLVDDDPLLKSTNSALNPATADMTNNSEPLVVDPQTNRRATRAIDIFSLGCVFYYCLTQGSHPFDKDGKFMREANIVKGLYDLDALTILGDYQWEAKVLVGQMLSHNPKERPDASTILTHPFFWGAEDRLEFLCHVSDAFESEKYNEQEDDLSEPLAYLESYAPLVSEDYSGDFLRALPQPFKDTLGKQRKYKGESLLDLLRALRNKKNHYEDMPDAVKERVGPLPAGYLGFWSRKFPSLLLTCWSVVKELGWEERDRFKKYYGG